MGVNNGVATMFGRRRAGCVAVALATAALAGARSAKAAVLYNETGTLSFIGDSNTLQTITLAGATAGTQYRINSLTAVVYYRTTPAQSPVLLLDVYQGTDETTPTNTTPAVDVLRNASEAGYVASLIPAYNTSGARSFTFGNTANPLNINVASGTFSINVGLYTDATFDTFSTDVVGIYSSATPAAGTNTGYTYIDGANATPAAPDGEFDSDERRVAGTTNPQPLNIAIAIDATPVVVPEPATAVVGVAAAVFVRRRNRRIGDRV